MRRCFLSTFIIAVVFFFANIARADGLIIVQSEIRVPGHFAFAPMEVGFHHVSVEIDDNVAATSVDEEFINPSSSRVEGTYIFPLPPGAHIDKFSMDINGTQADAELLSADKAKSLYEEIVRKMRDPALLEYTGRDAFKVRIFPIEPHATKHVKIRYTQLCKIDSGMVEYDYPLNTEKFSSKLIPSVSVDVKIKSSDALKTIYSPSHNIDVHHDSDHAAHVSYEEKNVRPDTDFRLLFSRDSKDVGIKLLTCPSQDGGDPYFMLMASPSVQAEAKVTPKDIVFVLDTSGSMADRNKIGQAKKALNFCLANLNDGDRFNVIHFATEADALFAELEHPTADRVSKAREFVETLKATGGTNIDDALATAIKCRQTEDDSAKRPFLIVFLTDGAPTVGVTDEDELVKRAVDRAGNVRIFCFGIGQDVNTHLLDRLAESTRAASQYVLPDEDIEVKVSNFYAKIKEPVMTNLKVAFTGEIKTSQIYPSALPDIFKGDTLILFGRYSGHGPSSVNITGTMNGAERTFTEDANFDAGAKSELASNHEFIPMLWATRRVGYLLDQIRQHGENAELKNEIVDLARKYGIVTPYTAYLIMEDENHRGIAPMSRSFNDLSADQKVADAAKSAYGSNLTEAASQASRSGAQAVANAQAYDRLRKADNMQQSPAAASPMAVTVSGGMATTQSTGYRVAQNYAQQVRVVGGRAFYQNANMWTDSTAQSRQNLKQQAVKFNSDDYFKLVEDHPAVAQWLSLGNNIDVVLDNTLYQIRDN